MPRRRSSARLLFAVVLAAAAVLGAPAAGFATTAATAKAGPPTRRGKASSSGASTTPAVNPAVQPRQRFLARNRPDLRGPPRPQKQFLLPGGGSLLPPLSPLRRLSPLPSSVS